MSIQAVAWVLENSQAEGYDRLVLLAIANHVHLEGDQAWPSVSLIGAEARVGRATVYRSIQRLIALGEIEIEHGGGRGHTNTYRFKGLPAETVKPQKRVSQRDKRVSASSLNGLTRATQNHKNRNEPKAGLVIIHCPNCLKPEEQCFCGYGQEITNADR